MQNTFLVLAIGGAIIPYLFFIPYISEHGASLTRFTMALFVNGAAGGIAADLFYTSFVFWLVMYAQFKQTGAPKPWLFILLNLIIGLSCALPAWLYARESQMSNRTEAEPSTE